MKFFNIVSIAFLVAASSLTFSMARADMVLDCTGGAGGPTPAYVTATLHLIQGDKYSISLRLVNPNFPNGISGQYVGVYTVSTAEIAAEGKINSEDSQVYVEPGYKSKNISLYARNGKAFDRRIETGFGAHFKCDIKRNSLTQVSALIQHHLPFTSTGGACDADGGFDPETTTAAENNAAKNAEAICGSPALQVSPFTCTRRQNFCTTVRCHAEFVCAN